MDSSRIRCTFFLPLDRAGYRIEEFRAFFLCRRRTTTANRSVPSGEEPLIRRAYPTVYGENLGDHQPHKVLRSSRENGSVRSPRIDGITPAVIAASPSPRFASLRFSKPVVVFSRGSKRGRGVRDFHRRGKPGSCRHPGSDRNAPGRRRCYRYDRCC